MMRSMFAGVSGLRAHQMMMDVVGDNIANVNTTGFKSSRVVFQDQLAQMLRGGSSGTVAANGQSDRGGVESMQVGLGVRVAAVERSDVQGALQTTGRATDVGISGSGYLAVRAGDDLMFTRAGNLSFDARGNLVDPTGMIVQGWLPTGTPARITPTGPVSDIRLPLDAAEGPVPTSTVHLGGNLSAEAPTGATSGVLTAITVYDNLGIEHTLKVSMQKAADNQWDVSVSDGDTALGTNRVSFDPTGRLLGAPSFTVPWNGAPGGTLKIDLGSSAGTSGALTQFGGGSTAIASEQDGSQSSSLRSFAIAEDGTVTGVFSSGRSKVLGQIALATFSNAARLQKAGENHFRATPASGNALMQAAGTGTAGTLAAGTLEMSNVDLGQEFTNLIIAQRGFQANSRIISASDEILQDLVNLKR